MAPPGAGGGEDPVVGRGSGRRLFVPGRAAGSGGGADEDRRVPARVESAGRHRRRGGRDTPRPRGRRASRGGRRGLRTAPRRGREGVGRRCVRSLLLQGLRSARGRAVGPPRRAAGSARARVLLPPGRRLPVPLRAGRHLARGVRGAAGHAGLLRVPGRSEDPGPRGSGTRRPDVHGVRAAAPAAPAGVPPGARRRARDRSRAHGREPRGNDQLRLHPAEFGRGDRHAPRGRRGGPARPHVRPPAVRGRRPGSRRRRRPGEPRPLQRRGRNRSRDVGAGGLPSRKERRPRGTPGGAREDDADGATAHSPARSCPTW